jgi:hypothetical protein
MRSTSLIRALTFGLGLTLGGAAVYAEEAAKGPNGGPIVENAGHFVEYTAKPDQIVLFLLDEAKKPLSSAKATGRVIALAGGKQTILELVATEPNMMIAKIDAPVAPATKLAVSITLADAHTLKGVFVAP